MVEWGKVGYEKKGLYHMVLVFATIDCTLADSHLLMLQLSKPRHPQGHIIRILTFKNNFSFKRAICVAMRWYLPNAYLSTYEPLFKDTDNESMKTWKSVEIFFFCGIKKV